MPYGSIKLTFEDLDHPGAPNIVRKVWYTWFDNPPYLVRNGNDGQYIRSLITLDDTPDKSNDKAMIKSEEFNKGEDIFKFKVSTGDHLFVNRITYNFRQPRRGDIAVFKIKYEDVTHPQPDLPKDDTFLHQATGGTGRRNSVHWRGPTSSHQRAAPRQFRSWVRIHLQPPQVAQRRSRPTGDQFNLFQAIHFHRRRDRTARNYPLAA